mmetsp:Transcript_7672/g.17938  ORF Transcript_7672/g.17938 Transcript_7672/m.17938 type:complete len:256 (+) Transcript_7672:500-1267(+)
MPARFASRVHCTAVFSGGDKVDSRCCHVLVESIPHLIATADVGGAVRQHGNVCHTLSRPRRQQIASGPVDAMRARLSADDHLSVQLELLDQRGVELRRGVVEHGHLRPQRRVHLGAVVLALEDPCDRPLPQLGPPLEGRREHGRDRVAGRAEQAVVRPDDVDKAAALLERGRVFEGPLLKSGVARAPPACDHLCVRDLGKRGGRGAVPVGPEGRMRDVLHVVRVERDDNVANLRVVRLDESGDARGVGIGAGSAK